MRKITFKNNFDYFKFYNQFKENIRVYSLKITKFGKILLFYDIM